MGPVTLLPSRAEAATRSLTRRTDQQTSENRRPGVNYSVPAMVFGLQEATFPVGLLKHDPVNGNNHEKMTPIVRAKLVNDFIAALGRWGRRVKEMRNDVGQSNHPTPLVFDDIAKIVKVYNSVAFPERIDVDKLRDVSKAFNTAYAARRVVYSVRRRIRDEDKSNPPDVAEVITSYQNLRKNIPKLALSAVEGRDGLRGKAAQGVLTALNHDLDVFKQSDVSQEPSLKEIVRYHSDIAQLLKYPHVLYTDIPTHLAHKLAAVHGAIEVKKLFSLHSILSEWKKQQSTGTSGNSNGYRTKRVVGAEAFDIAQELTDLEADIFGDKNLIGLKQWYGGLLGATQPTNYKERSLSSLAPLVKKLWPILDVALAEDETYFPLGKRPQWNLEIR